MLIIEPFKQQNLHSVLYNRIPENHILKRINNAVDFSFINELMEGCYCKYYGRPAKEPEMMARLLILQKLYNLSDERVIEETAVNLAYMWFIGINPDEPLPDPSLLCKFRNQRLQAETLDEIILKIVKQCVDKGIIKGKGASIDTTHTEANTTKKVPERVMKHLSKKILKNLEDEQGAVPDGINTDIPNYKNIEDHNEAKAAMKGYVTELIGQVKAQISEEANPKTAKSVTEAEKILQDPKFISQKGIRSLVDQDARVGYKSKNDSFFGYKTEYIMTTTERIITAVEVYDGAYVDGTGFNTLLNRTKKSGLEIEEFYGDKAFFRKLILDALKKIGAVAYIPVSASVYKIDESKFNYNKDSDEWFCNYGNKTVTKRDFKRNGKKYLQYYFDKETCRNCPGRAECIKGKLVGRSLRISINTPEFYEYSQRAKTREFLDKYKNRACHEWKNAELKRFHGLDRATGYGLKAMNTQAKLTALAVNLKRIANLVSSLNTKLLLFIGVKTKILCKKAA